MSALENFQRQVASLLIRPRLIMNNKTLNAQQFALLGQKSMRLVSYFSSPLMSPQLPGCLIVAAAIRLLAFNSGKNQKPRTGS